MANGEKIISQSVFEEAIKDILTELVNSTYSWESYSDEEIGNLVELDPTQVAELSAVISDTQVAKNKVFSSFHTKELLQQSVIEANKYADDLVANLSNIKLDIVDSLPDSSTVDKSTIYILKDSSGGTNNTLNVWSDSSAAFVEVGSLSVSMDQYYDKTTVDSLLADKANADSVVTPDDIITDTTQATGTNVLAASTTVTELDKKFDKSGILSAVSDAPSDEKVLSEKATKTELDKMLLKTSISTSIGGTPSDEKVLSEKATKTELDKKIDKDSIATSISSSSTNEKVASEKAVYDSKYYNTFGLKCPLDQSPLDFVIENTTANMIIHFDSWGNSTSGRVAPWASYIGIKHRDTGDVSLIGINNLGVYKINTYADGAWSGWRAVCTTKVDNVPFTQISPTNSEILAGIIEYRVINGTCYMNIRNIKFASTTAYINIFSDISLPKCAMQENWYPMVDVTDGTHSALVRVGTDGNLSHWKLADVSRFYTGSFSYPVKES